MKKLKLLNKWSFMYLFLGIVQDLLWLSTSFALKSTIEAIQNNASILIPMSVFATSSFLVISMALLNMFNEKKITIKYEFNLKEKLLRHYSKKSFKTFKETNFENHLLFDSAKIISDYMLAKVHIVYHLIVVIIYIVAISYISVIMLPIVIFLHFLTVFVNRFLGKQSSKINFLYSENRANYMNSIEDLLLGYNDAQSVGAIRNLLPLFSKCHNQYENKDKKLIRRESWINLIRWSFSTLSSLVLFTSLFLLTSSGVILVSTFLIFIPLNAFFGQNIQGFISSLYQVKSSQELIKKAFAKFESEKSQEVKSAFPISTKKLAFNSKNQVIKFKNLTIKSQEKILLKGKNGSGKSVFLKSLLGRINYDGEVAFNNKKLTTKSIAHFANYISTNPVILNCSIAKNILLNENETLNNTFKKTYAFLFHELPTLDQNASKLSYGQKQIICLLRALYKEPKLLIIDEAISGVAKKALLKTEEMLSHLSFSVIYVSHQVKTNFQANRVLVKGNNEQF